MEDSMDWQREDKKRPAGYHAAELEHADDVKKVEDAEKDVEAVSRPVTLEEQAAFRKAIIGRKGQA